MGVPAFSGPVLVLGKKTRTELLSSETTFFGLKKQIRPRFYSSVYREGPNIGVSRSALEAVAQSQRSIFDSLIDFSETDFRIEIQDRVFQRHPPVFAEV